MSTDPAKKLHSLLKKLRAERGEPAPAAQEADCEGCPEGGDRLLWRLVFAFLVWEAGTARACAAARRLHHSVIDYNEMRVCLADELAGMIGERYPKAVERCARLRSALNDLYRREHAVTLAKAAGLGKREAREYLDSLEGMPPFVAARVSLLALGGHAFPLDERMHQALLEESAVPADQKVAEAAGWLERQLRAGEALPAYLLLESWMNDRVPAKPAKKGRDGGERGERSRVAAKPRRAGKT